LADGSPIIFNVYLANIMWDGLLINLPVYEADADVLVGMRLMRGFRITIEDVDGGMVRIERM
jgi:hypothetical protein